MVALDGNFNPYEDDEDDDNDLGVGDFAGSYDPTTSTGDDSQNLDAPDDNAGVNTDGLSVGGSLRDKLNEDSDTSTDTDALRRAKQEDREAQGTDDQGTRSADVDAGDDGGNSGLLGSIANAATGAADWAAGDVDEAVGRQFDDEEGGGLGDGAKSFLGVPAWKDSDTAQDLYAAEASVESDGSLWGNTKAAAEKFDIRTKAGMDFLLDNPNASLQDTTRAGLKAATGEDSDESFAEGLQSSAGDVKGFLSGVDEATDGTVADNVVTDAGVWLGEAVVADPAKAGLTAATGVDIDSEDADAEGNIGAVDAFDVGVTLGTAGLGKAGFSLGKGAVRGADDVAGLADEGGMLSRFLSGSDEAASGADDAASGLDDAASGADEVLETEVVDEDALDAFNFVDDSFQFTDEAASGSDDAATVVDDAASGADDAPTLSDDSSRFAGFLDEGASGTDDLPALADDAASGADDAASGADETFRFTDEAASGADDAAAGADEAASVADDGGRFSRFVGAGDDIAGAASRGADDVASGAARAADETGSLLGRVRDRFAGVTDDLLAGSDDAAEGGFTLGKKGVTAIAAGGLLAGAAGQKLAGSSDPTDAPDDLTTEDGQDLAGVKTYQPVEKFPNGGKLYAVTEDFENKGYWLLLGIQGRNLLVLDANGNPRKAKISTEQFKEMQGQTQGGGA